MTTALALGLVAPVRLRMRLPPVVVLLLLLLLLLLLPLLAVLLLLLTARMRTPTYVTWFRVRIAPARRGKLTSNVLLLVISRSCSNILLVITATRN